LEVAGVTFGASFLDLIHNRLPHGAVGVGASFDAGDGTTVSFWVRIQHVSEFMLQVVSEFEIHTNGAETLKLAWKGREPLAVPGDYSLGGAPAKAQFSGLFPDSIAGTPVSNEACAAVLSSTRSIVQAALRPISYLGAFREPPRRTYLFPGGLPQNVGISGISAAALLGADFLRKHGLVLDNVGRWYADNLGGWTLGVTRQGDSFSIVLKSPDDPKVEINLSDAGTGMNQVLPLVVQRLFESSTGKRTALEIIEQPELHLHPAAQVKLGDLYVDALAMEHPPRFIIETHSENLLLRVRRRVAEGAIDPNKVVIYWVNDTERPGSRVTPIYIKRDGGVTDWPKGVFAEDFEEVRAIRTAQPAQTT
jgi:hypothetical protein